VPLASKSWDGNAADTQIFHDRAAALLATFQGSASQPRYLIADSKLKQDMRQSSTRFYHADSGYLKLVSQVSASAEVGHWQPIDDATRYHRLVFVIWHGPALVDRFALRPPCNGRRKLRLDRGKSGYQRIAVPTLARQWHPAVLGDHELQHRLFQVRPMIFGVAMGDRMACSSLSGIYAPLSEKLVVSRWLKR